MEFKRDIEKNKSEIIRVSIDEYKGEKLVNIRIFYKDKEGNWSPTKKGIAIRLDTFPKLKEVLDEIEDLINDQKKQ
ncbi:MAG: transcriptional coactivator p15/PC4 family protein [Leptonema sp. (in: bacteria)]